MLHAEEPDGLRALVWGGVGVENVAHGAVEMALAVLCGVEEGVRL